MVAAEAAIDVLQSEDGPATITAYPEQLKRSWVYEELARVRNIRPGFHFGLLPGLANAAFETLTGGRAPWTLHHRRDNETLKPANAATAITYPKPDGKITFDRLSSVFVSNTNHEENQPAHLKLREPGLAISLNLAAYDSPESRYCPAGVYEIVRDASGEARLQINAQNCVHCKTCDIKDPAQNIVWTVPEGGGGPNYPNM
jgi:electron-transferring-flavoprotein dehydrogenase